MQRTAHSYTLLDSGNGQLLEQIGSNIIIRPDDTAIWQAATNPSKWKADAQCTMLSGGKASWDIAPSFKTPWHFSWKNLTFELHLAHSKNVGIFPEQAENWEWCSDIIASSDVKPSVLNLFAYTGGASLAAAQAGAQVCHVDASQSAVNWASRNASLSKLDTAPIRWIVDDVKSFLLREIRRGSKYDALILDPPAYGRSGKKTFKFERDIHEILTLCKKVLVPNPRFVLLNCYAVGLSPYVAQNLLSDIFPKATVECGELIQEEKARGRILSCSMYARFHNN